MQINPASNILLTNSQKGAVQQNGSEFGDIFSNALKEAAAEERASNEAAKELLSGNITDIHSVTLQAAKAELALNLAIQIRNKVVDAYNEVMRMQV